MSCLGLSSILLPLLLRHTAETVLTPTPYAFIENWPFYGMACLSDYILMPDCIYILLSNKKRGREYVCAVCSFFSSLALALFLYGMLCRKKKEINIIEPAFATTIILMLSTYNVASLLYPALHN